MNDSDYMQEALHLARKGEGWVNPNPMVGAVLVKNKKIIGKGCHEKFGGLHAERNALANASESPEGSTLYVTLEPCCHYGKTPPCTEAILQSGIQRVVIGTLDPNPLVAGKGAQILRSAGIQVDVGILEEECRELIRIFSHFITTQKPYVIMKYAMTMDGKTAAYTGRSRWITGEAARAHVHQLRHNCMGIMVGVNTVLQDDPLLTCRLEQGKNPIRIVADTHLRTPLSSRIVQTASQVPVILATCQKDPSRLSPYRDAGCTVLTIKEEQGHLSIPDLMEALGKQKIDSILLEGGGTLNWGMLKNHAVHRICTYIAPMLLGGNTGKTPVGGLGFEAPDQAVRLTSPKITPYGEDFLFESEVIYPCSQES